MKCSGPQAPPLEQTQGSSEGGSYMWAEKWMDCEEVERAVSLKKVCCVGEERKAGWDFRAQGWLHPCYLFCFVSFRRV